MDVIYFVIFFAVSATIFLIVLFFLVRLFIAKKTLQQENNFLKEKISYLETMEEKLKDSFQSLSIDVLDRSSRSFLELATEKFNTLKEVSGKNLEMKEKAVQNLVQPIKESLSKFDDQLKKLENTRLSAYSTLNEQVSSLYSSQQELKRETGNLVKALRAPNVRGRWGELQLKRVCELAGLQNHCDFYEQESKEDARPDLIVKMPGGKCIIIDAKTPLDGYLSSLEEKDEEKRALHLKNHAKQVRTKINALSQKSYHEKFAVSCEFVVLFLPGEVFFSAALEEDPSLIEEGFKQKVILATPTTLVALMKTVAYSWKQETLAKNALEIQRFGKELCERIFTFAANFEQIKKGLDRAVDSYNKSVGSFEGRLMVTARKFNELGQFQSEEPECLEPIDKKPREVASSTV